MRTLLGIRPAATRVTHWNLLSVFCPCLDALYKVTLKDYGLVNGMGEIRRSEIFRLKRGFYWLFSAKFSENEEQQKGEQKRVGLAEKGALVRPAKGISTHKEKPSALHEEQ